LGEYSHCDDRGGRDPSALDALEVTRAGLGDGEALARFFAHNRAPSASLSFDPFELTAERAQLIVSSTSRDRFYLAWLDSELVAMSMLRGFDAGHAVPSFGILVDRRHRGRGVGRRVTVWTLDAARAQRCPAVRLTVYASNNAAVALYRSLGFLEHGRAAVERHGSHDEKVVMQLDWRDGR
jgi:ribosomal protein S18 acetylase RimI-like enzyme